MSNFIKHVNHDLPVEEGFRDWPKAMITKAKHFLTSKSLVMMDINELNKAISVAERAILTALDKEIANDSTSDMKQLKHALQKVSKRGIYSKEHKLIINTIANPKDPLQNIQHTIPLFVVRFTKMYPKSEWLDTSPEADRGDFSKDADDFNTLTERLRHAANEEAKKLKLEGKIVEYSGDGDWDDPGEAWFEFAFHPGDYFERNPMSTKASEKEVTQEALFPFLVENENAKIRPVREMSEHAAIALTTASMFGIIGLGMGVMALVNKGIDKIFGNRSSNAKVTHQDAEKVKQLSQQFLATQQIDSAERRKVFNEAYGLLKKHFDSHYFKEKAIEKGTEWNDPAEFYSGKINIIEFAFTQSRFQSLVGDDKIPSDLPEEEYNKRYDKLANKWLADVSKAENAINKELSKKYNGKYRIFFEELDGGYWDYYAGGDGDEGAVIVVDVDIINRMKSYVKNHATKESFTLIDNEAEPVEEGIGVELAKTLGWVALLFGAMSYKHYKEGKKEREVLEKKQEAEAKKYAKEAEDYVKKTDYLKSHPVNTKERKAVYIETLSAIDKFFDKSDIVLKGTEFGNPKVFTGEANPELPDIFCIDVGGTVAFQQMTTVWDAYSELEKSDKDKAEKYLDKEQKEWEDDLYSKLKAVNKELHKKYGSKYKLEMETTRDYFIIYLIDTAYKAGLLNAVKEQFDLPEDSYSAVTEGWGVVFTRFAVKHNLPFAKKLEDKIWQWSETTVNKLISLPEFKSYIDREASTVFKEEVKKNKNLSLKITPDMIEKFEETYADEAQFKKTESRNCCFCQKVGLYYIGVFGDKSHIHGVWLLMSDVRNRKIFAKALPAPSPEEMKKLGYQE